MDFHEKAKKFLQMALEEEGVEQAEVFFLDRKSTKNSILREAGEKKFFGQFLEDRGVAFRVKVGGRLGFAYSSDLDEESVRFAIRQAVSSAQETQGFESFPSYSGLKGKVEYDEEVISLDEEGILELVKGMEEVATSYSAITPIDLTFEKATVKTAIFNTEGSELVQEGTYVGASATLSYRDEKPIQYSKNQLGRRLGQIDPRFLVREVSEELIRLSKDPVTIESDDYESLLSPTVVTELLSYSFVNSLCADQVRSGVSPLADKLGEEIATQAVSIWDDPTYEGGLYTTAFDDEGVPSSRTFLIEDGILKGYMYDSIAARLGEFRSTSNCARWESPLWDKFFARSYKCRPRIWMSNLVIKPGKGKLDDLLSEISKGICCLEIFAGFTMSPSGDFSLPVLHGYYIEKGQIVGPIRGFSIKGNVFELLKTVVKIGEEPEITVPNSSSGSVVTPPILVEKMRVAKG